MEKDIIDGPIGNIGSYDVEFKGGYLVGKVAINTKALGDVVEIESAVAIKLAADAVIDAIKKAIPGEIDDAILEVVKAALKAA